MAEIKNVIKGFYTVEDAIEMDYETVQNLQFTHLNKLRTIYSNAKYFTKAEGSSFTDHEGNRHVDMIGAVGVCSVGNNNEFVWEKLKLAFDTKQYMMGCISYNNMAAVFAHNLALLSPGGKLTKVTTATGGAEAIEGAIKLVKIASRSRPDKTHILAAQNAFHGKTIGAVSVGGKDTWRMYQEPLMGNVDHVPYGDSEALETALKTGKYQGFFVEPIQGEGGIIVPPKGYLKKARELCTKYETYLVIDEIQAGCGRSGKFWCCQHEDIIPDCIVFAKGVSGGMVPFGGYNCTEELFNAAYGDVETCFHHTATYQNNALSSVAGIAAIQYIFENDLVNEAARKGTYFMDELRKIQQLYPDIVKEIRGMGLMIGMEFFPTKSGYEEKYGPFYAVEVERYLQDEYRIQIIHTINNPSTFRFLPPLNVPQEDIDYTIKAFASAIRYIKEVTKDEASA